MLRIRPWRISPLRDALLRIRVQGWRRRAARTAVRGVIPEQGLIVVGALSSISGIAQGARLMAAQMAAAGHPCLTRDLSRELQLDTGLSCAASLQAGQPLPALPRVIHLNPPHFLRALHRLGPGVFDAPVIAYWAWELPRAPSQWRAYLPLLDEIWVPSPFVCEALRRSFAQLPQSPPIRIRPHAVMPAAAASPEQRARVRRELGLQPQELLIGFSFSTLAGVQRKNPEALIRAFLQAFDPASRQAQLLIRIADADRNPAVHRRLQGLCQQHAHIRLVRAERLEIADFFAGIDVLASLHRAEGYGLLLAEALAAGTPVVACDWELSDTIRSHPLFNAVPYQLVAVVDPDGPYRHYADQVWAEPDCSSAAQVLHKLWRQRQAPSRPDANRLSSS